MAMKKAVKKAAPKVDLAAALAKASKVWGKASKRAREESANIEFDDGRYIARLSGGAVEMSQQNKPMIHWQWTFLEGDYAKKTKHAYQMLATEDNVMFLARDLERLGYDVEEIDDIKKDLPKILKELSTEKPVCRIQLKTKGGSDFQNVNILKRLDDDEFEEETDEEDDEDAADDADDDGEEDEEEESDDDESEEEESDDEESDDEDEDEEEESDDEDEEEESDDEDDEDEDAGDDDEEEVTVRVGSTVVVQTKTGKKKGEVTEIDAKANTVRVTLTDGKKVKLSADKILSVESVPEEPKKKAAKPVAKKVTKKVVKKTGKKR